MGGVGQVIAIRQMGMHCKSLHTVAACDEDMLSAGVKRGVVAKEQEVSRKCHTCVLHLPVYKHMICQRHQGSRNDFATNQKKKIKIKFKNSATDR